MKNYTRGAIAAFLTTKAVAVALVAHHLGQGLADEIDAEIDNGADPLDALVEIFAGRYADGREYVYVDSPDWGEIVVAIDNSEGFELRGIVYENGGDCGPAKRARVMI